MWTRAELKAKGKAAFKRNYWRTVLVALIVLVVSGGGAASGAASGAKSGAKEAERQDQMIQITDSTDIDGVQIKLDDGTDMLLTNDGGVQIDGESDQMTIDDDGFVTVTDDEGEKVELGLTKNQLTTVAGIVAGVSIVVILIAVAIGLLVSAFLLNPLMLGTARFFLRNLDEPARIGEVGFAFDHNYLGIVKTLFLRDIRILLWSLLLIIPGIVKSFEYRMIPYLLADDPNMSTEEAFAESKRLMSGNKWKAFVLDLSFIGWLLLGAITLGILDVFYVNPYAHMTNAALYQELRYGGATPAAPAVEEESEYSGHHFA